MKIIYIARNLIQALLIKLILIGKPFLRSKLFLFSEFMASRDRQYLLTKKGAEYYMVFSNDLAVSRKLYIGADIEHVKVVKALDILARDRNMGRQKLDLLIDIGANLGHICIPIVGRGFALSAIAFEPDPNNFRLCNINISLNNLSERIKLHNTALGENEKESLNFELSEDNSGDHRIHITSSDGIYGEARRRHITVPSTTLNSYFAEPPNRDKTLIWMDVQGYEGFVIAGASKLLSLKTPLGLEFWPYGLARANSFERLMRCLEPYQHYYDLNSENGAALPIQQLHDLYTRNIHTQFTTDILLL